MLNIANKLAWFAKRKTFGLRGRRLQTVIVNCTFYVHQEHKLKIKYYEKNIKTRKRGVCFE